MVVGQDVGEAVLGPVAGQIRERARLVATHMFQFFEFFAESEVRIGGHQSVVIGEVFDSDRSTGLDHRVGQRHVVIGTSVRGLASRRPPPPDVDDDQEQNAEEDQRNQDAEYYIGVVLIWKRFDTSNKQFSTSTSDALQLVSVIAYMH